MFDRHALTLDAARPEAIAKRHALGLRTARENVADLVDPGSFVEYGALAYAAQTGRRSFDDLTKNTPADGIVSHNSGALEQDADLVVLIYRDDVYNKDPNSPDAGTAELILAKQCNGPTGVVKLAFLREQTRFASLAPGAG